MWEPIVFGDLAVRDIVPTGKGVWVVETERLFYVSETGRVTNIRSYQRAPHGQMTLGVVGEVLFCLDESSDEIWLVYPDGHNELVVPADKGSSPAAVSVYCYEALVPEQIQVNGVGDVYLYRTSHGERLVIGKKMAAIWKDRSVTFLVKENNRRVGIRILDDYSFVQRVALGENVALVQHLGNDVILSPGGSQIYKCYRGAVERDGSRIAMLRYPKDKIYCWQWGSSHWGEVNTDFDTVRGIYLIGQQIWVVGERDSREGIFFAPFPELNVPRGHNIGGEG